MVTRSYVLTSIKVLIGVCVLVNAPFYAVCFVSLLYGREAVQEHFLLLAPYNTLIGVAFVGTFVLWWFHGWFKERWNDPKKRIGRTFEIPR